VAWVVSDQQSVKDLNEAVNRQWAPLAHLERLSRWHGNKAMHSDLVQLRANTEDISASLNEALAWEGGLDDKH